MAVPNIGQVVAAAFNRVVTDKPEDQIFGDLWLWDQFTSKNGGLKKVPGGNQIEVTIEYGKNTTFKSHSDMETLPVQRIDVFDAAQYDWREHSGTITYSILQKFKASGDTAKFDLIAGLIDNALNSHKDDIDTAMYGDGTGNDSKDMLGLKALIPAVIDSGVLGGINRATFSFWRSNQSADGGSSGSTLRASMRTMYNDCSNGIGGAHPTVGVSDQASFELYESLLTTNERFTSKGEGDGGFKNEVLKFKGMKLAYTDKVTAGYMYFMSPKFMGIYVAQGVFVQLGEELEPINQHIRVRKIHTIIQMVAKQPRRLGVVTSIA
jgi:hypothetical protein